MIAAVTTCSADGWRQYGHRMVESWLRHWPADARLVVYVEGWTAPSAPNLVQAHFPAWFLRWKMRHEGRPDAVGRDRRQNRRGVPYDFRRDCVRFAHKVAAIVDATDGLEDGLAVWLDADTLTHEPVDEAWLRGMLPAGRYLAWLERTRPSYPECGFLLFDCGSAGHSRFMDRLRALYESDAVFRLSETHDSFAISHLVASCVGAGWLPAPVDLSGSARTKHHPFPASVLGERLDHCKGARKAYGRTPKHEVSRREGHWR